MAKMLMDNYAGIAQAVNLVAEFLILAGIFLLIIQMIWFFNLKHRLINDWLAKFVIGWHVF